MAVLASWIPCCTRHKGSPSFCNSIPTPVTNHCSTSNIPKYEELVILRDSRMNEADNDRIYELCSLISVEQDRDKFLALVQELNNILSAGHDQLPEKLED